VALRSANDSGRATLMSDVPRLPNTFGVADTGIFESTKLQRSRSAAFTRGSVHRTRGSYC